MKKLFTLGLTLILSVGAVNSQVRKTWDFTTFSDETKENLNADVAGPQNWIMSKEVDGVITEWKDNKKLSGKIMANGIPIKELEGLEIGTAGLSKNNNMLVRAKGFRMSRAKMELILPKLAPGQTVTLRAQSANATATGRGFVAGNGNLEYISGPEGGICLGNKLEGAAPEQDGNYTLVWKVVGEGEDSVDVKLRVVGGGCDIVLVQIDEGDNPADDRVKIAYLYDSETTNPDNDVVTTAIFPELVEKMGGVKITPIDINAGNADLANVTSDSLQTYSVVVLSDLIPATNPYVSTIKSAIAFVPMLNLTPGLYPAWGYGNVAEGASGSVLVGEAARGSKLFLSSDVAVGSYVGEDGMLSLVSEGNVLGYTAEPGSYFYNDSIIAKTGDINAIHAHNIDRNAYMMIPYAPNVAPDENVIDVFINAVEMLNDTKVAVSKASKATISEEYHHKYTTVSLKSSTKRSNIYYTLDGSEPTTESTLYTEPFDLKESLVVKALVVADGYYNADVVEKTITINELAGAPTISLSKESGKTTVTLIPANEGDVIKYNYMGSTDSMRCSNYVEPIVLTKHATITFFTAEGNGKLQSEPVSQFVDIDDEVVRIDVVSSFNANKEDWSLAGASPSYYIGKNPYSFYDIDNPVGEDAEGNLIYNPMYKATYHNPGKGWAFKTYGQMALWQSTSIGHNPGDFNGYNPQTAEDDDDRVSNYFVSFSSVETDPNGAKDPYSACLYTTEAIQGPFDVVGFIGGYNTEVALYVATDTIDADKVGSDKWQLIGNMSSGTIKGNGDNGKDGSSRIWRKTLLSYEGTDKVFVKVAAAATSGNVLDVLILNHGEKSEEYVTGIEDVMNGSDAAGDVVRTMVYSINGTQLSGTAKGINIVKEVYANGVVKTRKVVVK
ncbi:chitobiase/beta-hexosaminidase C-terminal domain-containing protein [Xylanibacter muris]|uniref:GH29D-like beta-sandwich domain-containing protein n=1 Tax=Xylanibacter muris TaxID=2736290 RepID=A0ABX2AKV3_9BACT|nr:chitobiase/beta-hexosaminidase C-terminal domain-containing protein [Xylanibacter muris]NPD91823.1 hypothetical protein [Xylanibacter muris]